MKIVKGIINLCILLFRKFKNRLQGNKLTEKGERLLEYLIKVINENYMPQTMADYTYEEAFNPEKLEGGSTLKTSRSYFSIIIRILKGVNYA